MYLLTTNCLLILFFKLLLPKFQEVASQAQFLFSCHHILEKSANQFPEERWHMLAKNSWYDSIISGCRSFWWRSDRTQVPFILKPNKNVWMETNLSLVCLSITFLSLLNISIWQIQRWFVLGESSFKVSLTEFADTLFLLDPRFNQLSLKLKCLNFLTCQWMPRCGNILCQRRMIRSGPRYWETVLPTCAFVLWRILDK